jgi:hypothetical protein
MGNNFCVHLADGFAFLAVVIKDVSGWDMFNLSEIVCISRCYADCE